MKKQKLPPIEPETLRDLLMLADVLVPLDDVINWTDEARELARDWAGRVHLRASDNIVRVPPKPTFLNEYPAIPAGSGYLP